MSKFLTKEQTEDLENNGWKLIDNESGLVWFGTDWDTGWLSNITDLLPSIPDDDGGEGTGLNFLIIAYVPTNSEDEETSKSGIAINGTKN